MLITSNEMMSSLKLFCQL